MGSCAPEDPGPGIVDPACVQDTFVEGIGMIERIAGNCLRITLYASRDFGHGETERLVVARLIAPMKLLPRAARQVTAALEGLPFMSDQAPPDGVPS